MAAMILVQIDHTRLCKKKVLLPLTPFYHSPPTVILYLSEAATTLAAVLADKLHLPRSTFPIRQLMSPSTAGLSLGAVGAVGAVGGQWWNKEVGVVKNEEIIK